MLREKVMEWLGKTFGKPRHGDLVEMTCKAGQVERKGSKVLVEEIGVIFHRQKTPSTEKEVNKWKKELDEITGGGLRGFHTGNEELWGIAGPEDVKRGAQEGALVRGTGILLNLQIYKETFISPSVLFPTKIGSNRRH